jgi:hypothetical protein
LKLKSQIIMFNHLLEQQVAMVQKVQRSWDTGGDQQFSSVPQFVSSTAGGIPLFQHSGPIGGKGPGPAAGAGRRQPPQAAHAAAQQQQLDPGRPPQGGVPGGDHHATSSGHGHLGFPNELAHHVNGDEHSHGANPLLRVGSEHDLHKSLLHDLSPLHGGGERAPLPPSNASLVATAAAAAAGWGADRLLG